MFYVELGETLLQGRCGQVNNRPFLKQVGEWKQTSPRQ